MPAILLALAAGAAPPGGTTARVMPQNVAVPPARIAAVSLDDPRRFYHDRYGRRYVLDRDGNRIYR